MKKIAIIIGFLLASNLNFAQHTALIDSANAYYTNAEYEKAIEAYQQIVTEGYQSAELYYNLGNAYYKSNKIAYAIANYERSLKLNPNDESTKFNLKLANTHVVDKINVLPQFFLKTWWQKLIDSFDSNTWAVVSIIAFVFMLTLLLFFFLSNRSALRKWTFVIGLFALFITIFTFSFSKKQKWLAENQPDAIVLSPSVVVKSSPDESGTELFLLHEGLKVSIIDQLGDWQEVKLSDGNRGWLQKNNLIIIDVK